MENTAVSRPIKYIPNILSSIRIIGALALPFLMWESWEKSITLPLIARTFHSVPIVWIVVFITLVCTDKLDGTLARKYKVESALGAALDSIGDALILAMGATLCFTTFVRASLEEWRFALYIGIMIYAVFNRAIVFLFAYIYHGKANATHSFYQKGFAICCYIAVVFWAFLRTVPPWSIYSLVVISIIATVDEGLYCKRAAKYDINFKGHGFEKYERRIKK